MVRNVLLWPVFVFLGSLSLHSTSSSSTDFFHSRDTDYSWETKEFLRKMLVGKQIRASVDYSRKPQPAEIAASSSDDAPAAPRTTETRLFYTVLVDNQFHDPFFFSPSIAHKHVASLFQGCR